MSTDSHSRKPQILDLEDLIRGQCFTKIPFKTPLEIFFRELTVLLLFVLGLLVLGGYVGLPNSRRSLERWSEPIPGLIPFIPYLAGLAILGALCWRFTDVFYFLDKKDGTLYRSARFFWVRRLRRMNPAADIAGVTVAGRTVVEKGSRSRWQYQVVAVDQTGGVLPLSDWTEDFSAANGRSVELAVLLGAHHQEGVPERELVALRRASAVGFEFRPHSIWRSNLAVWILLLAVVVLAIVLVLGGYVFT